MSDINKNIQNKSHAGQSTPASEAVLEALGLHDEHTGARARLVSGKPKQLSSEEKELAKQSLLRKLYKSSVEN